MSDLCNEMGGWSILQDQRIGSREVYWSSSILDVIVHSLKSQKFIYDD